MNLKEAVAKVYMKICWECNKEFKDKKWALCEVCRNK
jgi:rRNA maturation endonuclease Nob1